jgi:hypothetical protein
MRWSYSAHAALRRCARQFLFGHALASHNAKDSERREAYVLKQLQHLSAWQGGIVHRVLATDFFSALRVGQPIAAAALTARAHDLARRQFAFSAGRHYRQPGQTKRGAGNDYCALFEHEYGLEILPGSLANVLSQLARCFEHLASQADFLARVYAGSRHLAEPQLSFRVDGATVVAIPDLVFLRAPGQPTVVDWKVAESETSDYSRQLLVYALAVARCGRWLGVPSEAIELLEVNLLKNQVRQHQVNDDRLQETEDFIYRSLVELRAFVGNSDFDARKLDELDVADRPGTCFHCNFGRLCVRRLQAASRLPDAELVQERLL